VVALYPSARCEMPLLSLYREIRKKKKLKKRRKKFLGFLFFMVFGKERGIGKEAWKLYRQICSVV
jgi:hypothetical protein